MIHERSCDLFCTVIDNFGDIGVCWRLARQLVAEHGYRVRLWVDDLASFQRICPSILPAARQQTVDGVEVWHWCSPMSAVEPHALVIEAFACRVPKIFLQAMVGKPLLWLNLDYLSAEAWVDACHGLHSPHPHLALTQRFFFPGFRAGNGGVLREADVLAHCGAFQADVSAQTQFWAGLGVAAADERRVSMFCYESPAIAALLHGWQQGPEAIRVLVPEGRALLAVNAYLGTPLAPGDQRQVGRLVVQALPFTDQDQYDRLLWACDANIVRGEDSLVRALWAGKPLLWHIYAQEDGAHWAKLQAMIDTYGAGLAPEVRERLARLWLDFNHGNDSVAQAWAMWRQAWPSLCTHARQWREQQALLPDLASNLVNCHQLWVK